MINVPLWQSMSELGKRPRLDRQTTLPEARNAGLERVSIAIARCGSDFARSSWFVESALPHGASGPHGALVILTERIDIVPVNLRVMGDLAVLPNCETLGGANPTSAIAGGAQFAYVVAREMLANGRLPGNAANAIEPAQASFGCEPIRPVSAQSFVVVPLATPSAIFHEVCAYSLMSSDASYAVCCSPI